MRLTIGCGMVCLLLELRCLDLLLDLVESSLLDVLSDVLFVMLFTMLLTAVEVLVLFEFMTTPLAVITTPSVGGAPQLASSLIPLNWH